MQNIAIVIFYFYTHRAGIFAEFSRILCESTQYIADCLRLTVVIGVGSGDWG